jgi:nucleotide-binding universal stress UspA family protein
MEKINRILVCLDQSPLDVDLIKVANRVCEGVPEAITFINVIREINIPDEVKKEFPKMVEKALEDRKSEIRQEIIKYFSWPNVDVSIEVVQGVPSRAILNYAAKNNVDLIISGRKKNTSGVLMSRLSRFADCSFLIVPPGGKHDLERILVPTDFSDSSKLALEYAVILSGLVKNEVRTYVQHVFSVPTGYRYTGKTFEEFSQIMKDNASKQYEAFIRQVDTKDLSVEPVYSLDKDDDFIQEISRESKRVRANLIIIGARGQTPTSALFIGSRAERMVQMDTKSSLLVVRRRGEKAGFRDFLQDL